MLHGTYRHHVNSIIADGLIAGGRTGNQRTHIHLVASVNGTRETAGVRTGTDVIVKINMRGLIAEGCVCFWSENGVLLTRGIDEAGGRPCIPPRFIEGFVDRATGEDFVPLPTPQVDRRGAVRGGRLVTQGVLSDQEARRLVEMTAYSFQEQGRHLELAAEAEREQPVIPPQSPEARRRGEPMTPWRQDQIDRGRPGAGASRSRDARGRDPRPRPALSLVRPRF